MRLLSLFFVSIALLQGAVGQAPQGPDRVARLIEQTRDLRFRGAAMAELAAIGPEVIPAVLDESKRDGSYDLSVLRLMGTRATPALLTLLDDRKFGAMALSAISGMKDPVALPRLMNIAKSATDDHQRRMAIFGIANIEVDASLQLLEELMADRDPIVRRLAADAMSCAGHASLKQLAKAFVACEGHPESLRLRDTEEGKQLLLSYVHQGHPLAARALEALVFAPPDDVPLLKALLFGSDVPLREAAAKVLAALGTPAACQVLIDAYNVQPNSYDLSRRIVEAANLAEVRGTQSLLEPWLRSRVKGVTEALTLLAKWHPDDKSLVPLIRDRISGPDQHRRDRAIGALLTMRTGDAIPILIEAFEAAKREKHIFIEALGKTKDPASLAFLKELYEKDKNWRSWILVAVKYLPAQDVAEFLCNKLKEPDTWLRNQAIVACGRARVTSAVPQLCAMLDSRKESLANEDAIVDALSAIATPAAIKSLRSHVERNGSNPSRHTYAAISAIAKAGGEPALEALSGLFKSVPPNSQGGILYAIGRLDSKGVIPFLERVASDPIEYVMLRRQASDIIARQKGKT